MPAVNVDPYRPSDGLFECVSCGNRVRADRNPGRCPVCSGDLRNIAVPRE